MNNKKYDKIFFSHSECLSYIQMQEGCSPVLLDLPTRTEYYRCGDSFYCIRYSPQTKAFKLKKKILKDGRYLTFSHGGVSSAMTVCESRTAKPISDRNLSSYRAFNSIVDSLLYLNISREDAADVVQEAFCAMSDFNAESTRHFINIWRKRCVWNILDQRSRKMERLPVEYLNDIPLYDKPIEICLGNLLSSHRQRFVVNALLKGFSIMDISQLSGCTFASISCLRNRAVALLKSMNI